MESEGRGTDEKSKPAGSDFLQLNIAAAPSGRRAEWLTEQLRTAIADGRLPIGTRLPATRVLAGDLRVSRGVVTEAYQRLIEDGHVVGDGRRGTTVRSSPTEFPVLQPKTAPNRPLFVPNADAASYELLRQADAPIDLAPGTPDLAAFPRAAWLRAERAVIGDIAPANFGYGAAAGTTALRTAVSHWLGRNRGIRVDPAGIVVVAGVAQGLALVAQVLRAQGISAIAVEDPGSFGARDQLQNWGMQTPPVPVDRAGLRVRQLAETGARAVLTTPAHQFPTGVVLDGARRRALVEWAGTGGVIIEDDYDAEHRYDRPPVPAIRSTAPDHVVYLGSVSKLLAPALRIGWIVAPPRYVDALVKRKRDSDLGNAVLAQLVLAELMESGDMERHLRYVRKRHRRRRDTMIAAIRTHLPGATVHGAAAGLHLMITFDAEFDDIAMAAAAFERGVKIHPLTWHSQRAPRPGFVLGYAATPPAEIAAGIETLGSVLSSPRAAPDSAANLGRGNSGDTA